MEGPDSLPGVHAGALLHRRRRKRQVVNQWIRPAAYDAVIDSTRRYATRAIRPDPSAYDSGDNLHPNDAGYKAMADAINLSLFKD
jgi:hypothetical protein